MSAAGARLFAQYAYPPNELGYCGPPGAGRLLSGSEAEIERRARAFEGAWSYLEILARAAGLADPLDARVVEAYWVGNKLLDDVEPSALVAHLERRFAGQPGGTWREAGARATAHHSFQVFEVYPWAALLRSGRPAGPAVDVLNDCRIRVGMVHDVDGETAVVASRPLTWDGCALGESGTDVLESVRWAVGGVSQIAPPRTGDLVALHWDWVCSVIDADQAVTVRAMETESQHGAGLLAGPGDAPPAG